MKGTELKVQIPAPDIRQMKVKIVGMPFSSLIFHKWSEKAKREMLEKQMKKAQKGRETRNPEAEYKASFYYDAENFVAFPALCIKQAMIGAARNVEGLAMTLVRGAVFVVGDVDGLIPVLVKGKKIKISSTPKKYPEDEAPENVYAYDPKLGENVQMRQDMVRVGMGSADLRFRGQVKNWSMDFIVKYNAGVFSAEQVLNLLQIAGFSQGIGEWRPEKSGDFGTFEIAQ